MPTFRGLLIAGGFWLLSIGQLPAQPTSTVDFNRDIRPILSENCYFCHGPDSNTRRAGLRLDIREDAIDYGAIEPGDADSSEIVARVDEEDADLVMPPPESHKKLSERQKELLRQWVQQGAPYETHWSFAPLREAEVPEPPKRWPTSEDAGLPESPSDWIKNPIDAFILDRLADQRINPSPPADTWRLTRRLHLDLIGLPPSHDGTAQVRDDRSDEEYNDLVESLFRSPHHGERMAMDWLDVVRYADTVGFHGDQNQNIFPYRDWVIRAINRNVPFDQFTRQQLAGDLLPTPTTDDRVASGFNRLNMMTREGGAQPGEYLAKYAADRVRTVGMAWMGLTTGCAECHDHKFDPFTSKDFYSLAAYFDDVKQWGVYSDYGYTPNPELKGGNNDYPFYPEMEVRSEALLRRQHDLYEELTILSRQWVRSNRRTAEREWDQSMAWLIDHPSGWETWPLAEYEHTGEEADVLSDDSALISTVPSDRGTKADHATAKGQSKSNGKAAGNQTRHFRYEPLESADAAIRSLQVELLPASEDSSVVMRNDPTTVTLKLSFAVLDQSGNSKDVQVRRSDANRRHPDYGGTRPVLDITERWKLPRFKDDGTVHQTIDLARDPSLPLTAVFQFAEPVVLTAGERFVMKVKGGQPARVRVSVSPLHRLRPFDPTELQNFRTSTGPEDPPACIAIAMGNRQSPLTSQLRELEQDYRRCRDGWTVTMVTQAMQPKTTRVLPRGNWQDDSGQVVSPSVPEFLSHIGGMGDSDQRQTRLDLANWLVHPDNPLTPRVVVNRWWKHFFGQGLIVSADDVGAQGDVPSHPKLLDWLAGELIRSGWDRRHILRLIVTSNTYRQDSQVRQELYDRDPNNRLLAFHPPRRLEAEVIRDNALAIAGLLNPDLGGPPIKPYQPPGYYSNLQFPDREYQATRGVDQYRRGIYMHWQRTFLHPMLANFDAPSREDCVALRSVANTPQQALTLLNDPTFVESAIGLAKLALSSDGDDERRLARMIRRAVHREPREGEVERLQRFLDQQRERYAEEPAAVEDLLRVGQPDAGVTATRFATPDRSSTDDAVEVAAWTATARVLLNLHETITRF